MAASKPRGSILDVGCGTGEDALWLAAQGYAVHGIDPSSAMISEANAKAARSGSSATFECRSLEAFGGTAQRFDTVVSNFGALNCVPLATWTEIVPRLLTPSGRGFVVLMGRKPLPENLRAGKGSKARGLQTGVRLGEGRVTVDYESTSAIVDALSAHAHMERVEALGCLVPGPGYAGFGRRHPISMGLLAMGESLLRGAPFFRGRGDHTLFEFRAR